MVALIADELLPPTRSHQSPLGKELEGLRDIVIPLDAASEYGASEYSAPKIEAPEQTVPRPVLSLLPMMANTREKPRRKVALKAWLMTLDGATRGYALDLSEGGARLGGMGTSHPVGETILAKICLEPHESPVVLRCEVIRYAAPAGRTLATEVAVRFVDVNLDEWFRLGRYLDKEERALAKRQRQEQHRLEQHRLVQQRQQSASTPAPVI